MLTTVLLILKIIGIALLCIVGVLLTILLLVLICPVRYAANVQKADIIKGYVKVSWLFPLVLARVIYDKDVNVVVRILGIPVYNMKKRDAKKQSRTNNEDDKTGVTDSLEYEAIATELPGEEISDDELSFLEDKSDNKNSKNTENLQKGNKKKDNNNKEKPSFFTIIWEKLEQLVELVGKMFEWLTDFILDLPWKILDFIEKLEEKVISIYDTVTYYNNLLQKKGSRKVIEFLKNEVILILKHIVPKRSRIRIEYSNEDPAKVADMFRYYGMAMPFLPKHTDFIGEFGENRLEGTVVLKGRIVLGYLLWHALKVYFNKKTRTFIKLLKREAK